MSHVVVRVVSGLLAAAMIAGLIARPPSSSGQVLGALLPVGMLLAVALRGNRKSILPKKRP